MPKVGMLEYEKILVYYFYMYFKNRWCRNVSNMLMLRFKDKALEEKNKIDGRSRDLRIYEYIYIGRTSLVPNSRLYIYNLRIYVEPPHLRIYIYIGRTSLVPNSRLYFNIHLFWCGIIGSITGYTSMNTTSVDATWFTVCVEGLDLLYLWGNFAIPHAWNGLCSRDIHTKSNPWP